MQLGEERIVVVKLRPIFNITLDEKDGGTGHAPLAEAEQPLARVRDLSGMKGGLPQGISGDSEEVITDVERY